MDSLKKIYRVNKDGCGFVLHLSPNPQLLKFLLKRIKQSTLVNLEVNKHKSIQNFSINVPIEVFVRKVKSNRKDRKCFKN